MQRADTVSHPSTVILQYSNPNLAGSADRCETHLRQRARFGLRRGTVDYGRPIDNWDGGEIR